MSFVDFMQFLVVAFESMALIWLHIKMSIFPQDLDLNDAGQDDSDVEEGHDEL